MEAQSYHFPNFTQIFWHPFHWGIILPLNPIITHIQLYPKPWCYSFPNLQRLQYIINSKHACCNIFRLIPKPRTYRSPDFTHTLAPILVIIYPCMYTTQSIPILHPTRNTYATHFPISSKYQHFVHITVYYRFIGNIQAFWSCGFKKIAILVCILEVDFTFYRPMSSLIGLK